MVPVCASAAEATSHLLSLALPALVLAKAENMDGVKEILVPCSACYLNLKKVEEKTDKIKEEKKEEKEVKNIRLDPYRQTADVDESNNVAPMPEEPVYFKIYKKHREEELPNPMQRDRGIKP